MNLFFLLTIIMEQIYYSLISISNIQIIQMEYQTKLLEVQQNLISILSGNNSLLDIRDKLLKEKNDLEILIENKKTEKQLLMISLSDMKYKLQKDMTDLEISFEDLDIY